MNHPEFDKLFGMSPTPTIVCEAEKEHLIAYINPSAKLLLDPLMTIDALKEKSTHLHLEELLRFRSPGKYDALVSSLHVLGALETFYGDLINYEDAIVSVALSASRAELLDREYYVILMREIKEDIHPQTDYSNTLTTTFYLANQSGTVDEAINRVLAYIGSYVQVSRAYIFEEISAEDTRNTYEWCAAGVEPAIQDLQCLKKADYNYDVIINGGMYVTDDIRDLPEGDRDILAAQGIKSLAILPMFYADKPLGYIGFDDCNDYRRWSSVEINLLKNTASIITSLLVRRQSEEKLSRSRDVLQIISDNIENVIYVNDLLTYEVVFLNKTLADTIGEPVSEILGHPCWQKLQQGFDGPCPFCPMPRMIEEGYDVSGKTYTWEFQNTLTKKWYLLKDSIIPWIDGRLVHIETATEITSQKLYEEQLKHYASTDMMTGAYNREWGTRIMQEMLDTSKIDGGDITLVFLDIDGLKHVNDTYGHDAGDDLIKRTVQMIRSCTRKSDVLCRWGGDEFILLLRCDEEIAARIVDNIQRKTKAANENRTKPYELGFSYGLTSLTNNGDTSLDDIITEADQRMYANKMGKRDGAE